MQHLVLIPFFLLIAGLTVTAIVLQGGLDKTFSQRVANNKSAEILYSLLFIVTLPLLYLFFAAWFVPEKDVNKLFLLFAATAVVFQVACTFVPERGAKMTVVHRILTGISGVALLPLVLIIAISSNLIHEIRFIAWVCLAGMCALLAVALSNQKEFKYALLLQIGYYGLFFGVILVATYA